MPLSGEIGSGAVAFGPPRPPPLTDPRLAPRSYPRRGRGSVRRTTYLRNEGNSTRSRWRAPRVLARTLARWRPHRASAQARNSTHHHHPLGTILTGEAADGSDGVPGGQSKRHGAPCRGWE
eukprot:802336-Pleurochrysis_carterae.AAC.3